MMVFRIDRRKAATKITGGKAKGAAKRTGAAPAAGRGAGEGRVDRFEGLGRLIGGPSEIISSVGPGARATIPLTAWERWDIDHDPLFLQARERIQAYRNLPDKWKREVDKWGRKTNKDMAFSMAKAIMKG